MTEIFNPWEVKGDINYEKLVKEFGIKPLDLKKLPKKFQDNLLFRRGKIFAHRDYERILDCIENDKPFVMMTGLMPTGKFHIGHAILAKQMIFYQELGAKIYIAVADVEAYVARRQSFEESKKKAIEEYIKNYIGLGLKPKNVEIYFQSERSSDAKKSNAFYRLQNQLSNHITFNEFKGAYGEITPGKMNASLLQAADMLSPELPEFEGPIPVVVPVGIDQDPHIRLGRDMAKRIKDKKFIPLSSTYHLFVPGLNGGKMSSSDETSFIALTDDPKTIKNKVNKYAFSGGQVTVEDHRKLGGNPDIDVSYQWLTFYEEDDNKLKQIYNDYKSGKLLSGELKAILIERLTEEIEKVQKNRDNYNPEDFLKN